MPTATQSCGETVLPVWPTWKECGYQPASVTARDAPTAAPSASAGSSMILKPSAGAVAAPPGDRELRPGQLRPLALFRGDVLGDLRRLRRVAGRERHRDQLGSPRLRPGRGGRRLRRPPEARGGP